MTPRSIPALALRRAAALTLAACATGPALAQGPAPVHVDLVRTEIVQQHRSVTGDVRAVRRAEVASREPGFLLELPVREGDRVETGALLARVDSARLDLAHAVLTAQRAPAQARVVEQESELEQRARDVKTLEQLAGREAANPKELADARTAQTSAQARLEQAKGELLVIEARLAELARRIDDTRVRAPFSGTVTARRTEIGAWLREGDPVLEIVSTDDLELWLEVPQQLLSTMRRAEGASLGALRVRVGDKQLVLERYRAIPDVDLRARTFKLVAALDEEARRELAAGMSVTADIPTGERGEQLTVPRDAILRNEIGPYVFAVVGEGAEAKAVPMQIDVLFQVDDRVVVRPGRVAAGMQVVVEGNERLFPMAPVQPIPAGEQDSARKSKGENEAGADGGKADR